MSAALAVKIQEALPKTRDAYHKLVLAVSPSRTGKTETFKDLSAHNGWPRINVNVRLAERLLELTRRQRATRVRNILDEIVRSEHADVVVLDNIELLFDPDLAQDPLRLLQSLSRNQTIVAAWPGTFDGNALTYAEPGHAEWQRYTSPQAIIVTVAVTQEQ